MNYLLLLLIVSLFELDMGKLFPKLVVRTVYIMAFFDDDITAHTSSQVQAENRRKGIFENDVIRTECQLRVNRLCMDGPC